MAPRASSPLDRRTFLRGAVLTAAATTVGAPLLTACGGGPSAAGSSAAKAALPDYVSALKAKPELAGTTAGVRDGFTSPITSHYRSVTGEVADGSSVKAMLLTYTPPPPPARKNTFLQAVNKRANMTFDPQVTPAADYPAKFGAVTAGDALPDLVQMPLFMNLPRLDELLHSRFADLSEHLSGSRIRKYPNLAGIPTYAWKAARIAGRIYGIPLSRPVVAWPMVVRQDLLSERGLEQPTTAEEFVGLCKELTNARAGRWALGSDSTYMYDVNWFGQMYGAPMRWGKKPDGSLVKDWETEEFVQAVEFARKLKAAGYFHPDSGAVSAVQVKEQFIQGKVFMCMDSPMGWTAYYDTYGKTVPGLNIDALVPFAPGGGRAKQYLDTGIYSITAMKKAGKDRIEELLRVMNFLAAPYGSEEYELLTYGVKGVDHTVDAKGLPAMTDRGTAEKNTCFFFVAAGAPVLVSSAYPKHVKQAHAWEKEVVPGGVSDPTNGLFSETASRVGSQLTKAMTDSLLSIISGRGSLRDLKPAVTAWRNGGGDKMRAEYEKALEEDAK
ncbi:extracellular solute-binding protein [Streptomyces sp. NPDC049954]|uniref:extracellular solute-binding protein n=1 Tax=Streptomyces sp. NPDC049954 TaxID=3155779 RepID=UPI00343B8348